MDPEPLDANEDPGESVPRVSFDDLKVGKRVLVKVKFQGRVRETIGEITRIHSPPGHADVKVIKIGNSVFPIHKDPLPQHSDTEVYEAPQSGSRRRTRKQKRSRRVKGRKVRLGTRRVHRR